MKDCKFCGNQIDDDALFCPHCGNQIVSKKRNPYTKRIVIGVISSSIVFILLFLVVSTIINDRQESSKKDFADEYGYMYSDDLFQSLLDEEESTKYVNDKIMNYDERTDYDYNTNNDIEDDFDDSGIGINMEPVLVSLVEETNSITKKRYFNYNDDGILTAVNDEYYSDGSKLYDHDYTISFAGDSFNWTDSDDMVGNGTYSGTFAFFEIPIVFGFGGDFPGEVHFYYPNSATGYQGTYYYDSKRQIIKEDSTEGIITKEYSYLSMDDCGNPTEYDVNINNPMDLAEPNKTEHYKVEYTYDDNMYIIKKVIYREGNDYSNTTVVNYVWDTRYW